MCLVLRHSNILGTLMVYRCEIFYSCPSIGAPGWVGTLFASMALLPRCSRIPSRDQAWWQASPSSCPVCLASATATFFTLFTLFDIPSTNQGEKDQYRLKIGKNEWILHHYFKIMVKIGWKQAKMIRFCTIILNNGENRQKTGKYDQIFHPFWSIILSIFLWSPYRYRYLYLYDALINIDIDINIDKGIIQIAIK